MLGCWARACRQVRAGWPSAGMSYFVIFLLNADDATNSAANHNTNQRYLPMSDKEEKEQIIHEEDEYGNIIAYPVWSKKNVPKECQNKWEVPIYL
jgi:hypothetical protein